MTKATSARNLKRSFDGVGGKAKQENERMNILTKGPASLEIIGEES